MYGILNSALVGILLHGEPPFGWRGFIVFVLAVFFVVWLFDEMARREIKSIRKHRRSSFGMRERPELKIKLRQLISRARR